MENNRMDKKPETVPYIVHEGEIARAERHNKRMFIALIITIIMLFASNGVWLLYESLYDTITYEQDGGQINNINTGKQGNVTTPDTVATSKDSNKEK